MADRRSRAVGLVGDPSPEASVVYRAALIVVRCIGRGIFGFRTEVRGAPNLPRDGAGRPAGGWILAGMPHRTWVDPFVVADNVPVQPRLVFFGDGQAIFRSRWRRWLFHRIGGVIPIWPGERRNAIDVYLASAAAALEAGAVLCLFPETGRATEPGTARRFGLGLAYFALRTGAPIVPVILGGTHDLYRGRRFRLDVLPAVTARDLAGLSADAPPPVPWSSAERAAAHRITMALHELTAGPVLAAHRATEPLPGAKRHWRWLTTAWH